MICYPSVCPSGGSVLCYTMGTVMTGEGTGLDFLDKIDLVRFVITEK